MKANISEKKDLIIRKGNPLCLGVFSDKKGFHFSVNLDSNTSCGLYLWSREARNRNGNKISTEEALKIEFPDDIRIGTIYAGEIEGFEIEKYVYCYFCDDHLLEDKYGKNFIEPCVCEISDKEEKISIILAYVNIQNYDWEYDCFPRIPFENMIIYGIHVKGFTKHDSSQVKHKGTYKGLTEKLDYLKKLNITSIELMPTYEFLTEDIPKEEERLSVYNYMEKIPDTNENVKRANYWGYKKGLYFAPKKSYSSCDKVQEEFKDLVKAVHAKNMEVIMQFYFPDYYDMKTIIDALQFWVMEYHVDGFRLIGGTIPKVYLVQNGILSKSKLFFDSFSEIEEKQIEVAHKKEYIATINRTYLQDTRKFLKGDEDNIQQFTEHMYRHEKFGGTIHTLTDYWGFTLNDCVSYDRKHNELNGENNKDGTDFNFSWNCGEEGPTKKRKINNLRKKQMKNAFCMLLLSQATPYIRGGDEFAFSQQGNNNPYCQDNEITWLDWNLLKKNKEQVSFVKKLISFRFEHPILHMKKEMRMMDYLGCGYPDVSFHGKEAWRPVLDNVSRHVGMMYCGKYAMHQQKKEDEFIYIAYNMHWIMHSFALPRLPKGKIWVKVMETENIKKDETANKTEQKKLDKITGLVLVESRSVCVFISKER